jgi:hypothetical protein
LSFVVKTVDTTAFNSNGIIFEDLNSFHHSRFFPSFPIIPSGTNIKSSFSGILVDNSSSITPVVLFWEQGTNNSYTIPSNKNLIIKSGLGNTLDFKLGDYEIGNLNYFEGLLILPSNTTISNNTFIDVTMLFTGYLIDE